MSQNNVLQSEVKGYKKEDAYQSLSMINAWIGNIDTKVSFALALAGVIIGVIFENGTPSSFKRIVEVSKLGELNVGDVTSAILVGLLYLFSFISIVSFIWSIIARVKNINNVSSIFFFGSIAGMELENYIDRANRITEEEVIKDLEEQIHINSKICSQKAKWYNIGIKLLGITIVLWFICMTFGLI